MLRLLLLTAAIVAPYAAMAAEGVFGTDFRALALKAMTSPTGVASSEVHGQVADTVRGQIQAPNARVVATASVVGPTHAEDCKRMRYTITTPGTNVVAFDGKKRPLEFAFEFGLCSNGKLLQNGESRAVDMEEAD